VTETYLLVGREIETKTEIEIEREIEREIETATEPEPELETEIETETETERQQITHNFPTSLPQRTLLAPIELDRDTMFSCTPP